MARFGKHLHAKQNSKLAKYAKSANFAYLSAQTHNKCKNAKGLRPFKRSEPKTFATNAQQLQKRQGASTFQKVRTKKSSAQAQNKRKNTKGLRPFKRSQPKNLRHKRKTSAKTPRGF